MFSLLKRVLKYQNWISWGQKHAKRAEASLVGFIRQYVSSVWIIFLETLAMLAGISSHVAHSPRGTPAVSHTISCVWSQGKDLRNR